MKENTDNFRWHTGNLVWDLTDMMRTKGQVRVACNPEGVVRFEAYTYSYDDGYKRIGSTKSLTAAQLLIEKRTS